MSTKFTVSVALLLALVVAFLTLSSIILLKRDKTAYIYDAQATACTLMGREFTVLAQSTLDLARQAISWVDPFQKIPPDAESRLQFLLNNQSIAIGLQVGILKTATSEFTPLVRAIRSNMATDFHTSADDVILPRSALTKHRSVLAASGIAFVNLSRPSKPPLLGVLLVDRKNDIAAGKDSGLAFGVVSLQRFQTGIPMSIGTLAVYNDSGFTLFHADPKALIASSEVYEGKPTKERPTDSFFEFAKNSKINSGAAEFVRDGVRYLASYYKPGLNLTVTTRVEYAHAMKATYTLTEKFLLFGILSISVATILSLLFSRNLTRPLNRLYEATKEVSKGNFEIKLPESGSDEIGALTQSFTAMSQTISKLVKSVADKTRMQQELAVATVVQANLLPPPTYSDNQVQIKSYYKSASECGGDWWGHLRVNNRLAVAVADATGHGIPSALLTASVRGCFSAIHKTIGADGDLEKFKPAEITRIANFAVYESGRGKINMTFFVAVFDFESRTVTYCNAAHCPPFFIRRESQGNSEIKLLMSAGPRLGESGEMGLCEEHTTDFDVNDTLVFYTDGLFEGTNATGEAFGKKRARKVIASVVNRGDGHAQIVDSLVTQFLRHNGNKPLDDDLTLVAVRIQPTAFETTKSNLVTEKS